MIVIYDITSETLTDTLNVVNELQAIAGLTPECIIMDKAKISFSKNDFILLSSGKINEQEYANKNKKSDNFTL